MVLSNRYAIVVELCARRFTIATDIGELGLRKWNCGYLSLF